MRIIAALSELPAVASKLMLALGDHRVVALKGAMGAGKTTLVHALCEAIGVKNTVSSPTFSIIHEYPYDGDSVYHIDCYRLRDEEEAIDAGVEDCLFSGRWCFVEWPEKIPHIFPSAYGLISLSVIDERTRAIDLEIKL